MESASKQQRPSKRPLKRPLTQLRYLLAALGTLAATALGDTPAQTFSGFASLGIVSNDNADLTFRRDVTQHNGSIDNKLEWRTDSLIGLQWRSEWSYQFETTAQFVIKDRLKNTLEKSLEWGFLRYRPQDGLDIRIGRMGTDIFMLSDYHQVDYAFQWVRPPHDYYALLSFYHFDGIDLNKRIDFDESTLNIKLFYGSSKESYPIAKDTSADYKLNFEGGGLSANYEWGNWKLRYSYANVEITNNNANPLTDALKAVAPYWPDAPSIANEFITKGKHLRYNAVGASYDNNVWWAQTESATVQSEATGISNIRNFYLSVGRHFDAYSLYIIRGYVRPQKGLISITAPPGYPSPLAEQLAALANGAAYVLNAAREDQESIGAGIRWDFASKMALKAQFDRFHIEKNGATNWLQTRSQTMPSAENANVLSLSLDIIF